MKQTKSLTDIAICRLLNIPQMTFKEWKKAEKDNWRYIVYHFFKNMSEEEIKLILDRNKTLQEVEAQPNITNGVSLDEVKSVFDDELGIVVPDKKHSDNEERFYLIGMSQKERILMTVYYYREDNIIHIIFARKATADEKAQYEKHL